MEYENKFKQYFWNEKKTLQIHKWHHYLDIYDSHFRRFKNKNPIILEVGVFKGGSLEMWNYYFNNQCTIYGIDIDNNCLEIPNKLNSNNINISIGDQSDRNFWKQYLKDKPKFDIVIEDGGHEMQQQIITYEELINHVSDDGIYLCEDLHTSYWENFNGKLKGNNTFIEYSKNFVDMLNFYHIKDKMDKKKFENFRKTINSVHYYDSVIVLEKKKDEDKPIATKKQ